MLEAKHKMKLFFAHRPWEDEPDNAEWVQEPSGYKCRIMRSDVTGALCGYMGIPKEHRFWGFSYDGNDAELQDISDNVHGGLTYSAEGDDGWWYFGFDTNHTGDFAPKIVELLLEQGRKNFNFYDCADYKAWGYVEDEIHWLGKRLWQYNNYEIGFKDE
jgi:hypothetical protein